MKTDSGMTEFVRSCRTAFMQPAINGWGLLTAAGAVAAAATLLGFLGRTAWFLDLLSHFRVQYLLGLLGISALFFIKRHFRTAVTFLGFACINLPLILPLYFGRPAIPSQGVPVWRAMLLNVNTRHGDALLVRNAITEADPDILVLEEISDRWMADLAWLSESYPHTLTHPREDNFGIGLYSKLPIEEGEVVSIGLADVPSILATIAAGETKLRIVATHPLPPGNHLNTLLRNAQLDLLPDYTRSPHPLLLIGDLNTTPWNYHFQRLLTRSGLRDSARGFGVQTTWPSYNPLLRIPIDHCLHSDDIVIVNRRIGAGVSSDHYPLIVDFIALTSSME